ncbi:hypothetical protein Tco_0809451, partial [Tanacetum coccineum]
MPVSRWGKLSEIKVCSHAVYVDSCSMLALVFGVVALARLRLQPWQMLPLAVRFANPSLTCVDELGIKVQSEEGNVSLRKAQATEVMGLYVQYGVSK